jgi:hypothetical protein
MKKLLFLSTLLLCSLLHVSCSTDGVINNPITENPVDVYVAGSKDGQACYWKNGQIVMLNSGGFENADATKIIVSNNDVYVLGQGYSNSQANSQRNLYWKNGVVTNLNTTFSNSSQTVSAIDDMKVFGNDVYFVGFLKPTFLTVEIYDLVYWKNGVKTIVESNLNTAGSAQLAVQNNDVYVTFSPSFDQSLKGYYKNDVFYAVSEPLLNGVVEINNQITIFGGQFSEGFYKNTVTNVKTEVPFVNSNYIAKMCSDNNNIYYSNISQIYKNGNLFNETQAPSVLKDFQILNNNLYKIDSAVFGNPIDVQKIMINNTVVLTSVLGEFFESLFIVQN